MKVIIHCTSFGFLFIRQPNDSIVTNFLNYFFPTTTSNKSLGLKYMDAQF
jgi:hypothetical protein